MKPCKENNTFKFGGSIHLNACVGTNGFNGIETYEYGFDQAVNILVDAAKKDSVIVDPIIYPLLFSARHRIELFLKKCIFLLEELNRIRKKNFSPMSCLSHDIRKLWNHVKLLSSVDRRYLALINDLSPLIEDYCIIDLTGETFRYPYNKKNEHHLDDFSCINIGVFKGQYDRVAKLIGEFSHFNETLLWEYKTDTFTDDLSRSQIKAIAKELPPKDSWTDSTFDEVKKELKRKYAISSGILSEALDIIQKHREFSSYIKNVLPIKELSKIDYRLFKAKIHEFHLKDKGRGSEERREMCLVETSSLLVPLAISSLRAFYEIGYFTEYSEYYDPLVEYFLKEDNCEIYLMQFIDSVRSIEWIEKGMLICGQTHFLSDDAEVIS